jgi:vacuolar-type H+-ATPase subunit D/Vma8
MTDLDENLLVGFKQKMKLLYARHDSLKQEKTQLLRKIGALEQTISELNQKTSTLEQKYQNLKLAKMLDVSDQENKDAKSKIQKIVREIDQCIALLNR